MILSLATRRNQRPSLFLGMLNFLIMELPGLFRIEKAMTSDPRTRRLPDYSSLVFRSEMSRRTANAYIYIYEYV